MSLDYLTGGPAIEILGHLDIPIGFKSQWLSGSRILSSPIKDDSDLKHLQEYGDLIQRWAKKVKLECRTSIKNNEYIIKFPF
jgi:hypothetical protein